MYIHTCTHMYIWTHSFMKQNMAQSLFLLMDANKDGVVTFEEMMRALEDV